MPPSIPVYVVSHQANPYGGRISATANNSAFNAIHAQALALVDRETQVMPFTSPGGHVHILRHLQPEIVYLQESLAGEDGAHVRSLQSWSRHDIVLVVGADDGAGGGLADSEPEGPPGAPEPAAEKLWWQRTERVGLGRGVVVVDGVRVHDDWLKRVQGRE